jgi:hypothetical protein
MTMRHCFAVLGLASLALSGCDAIYTQQPGGGFGPPQVFIGTPGGNFPLYTPNTASPSGPSLATPPGLGVPNPMGGWNDGTYNGTATLLENDFGDCAFNFAMTNMHVRNGTIRFASFHGRIGADGGVRLQDGAFNWITGHLSGDHFAGVYTNRYCTYSLSLDRVGA